MGGRGADVCGVIGGRLWGARKVFGRGGLFTYWGNWGLRRGVHSPVGLMWLAEVSGGGEIGGTHLHGVWGRGGRGMWGEGWGYGVGTVYVRSVGWEYRVMHP